MRARSPAPVATPRPEGRVRRWPRLVRGLLIAGVAAGLAGQATFAAFSHSTEASNNVVAAGTVDLVDDDGGSSALLTLNNASSGDSTSGCILVTYRGSLPARVRLYGQSTGTLPPHLILTVTRGTGSGTGCGGWAPDATNCNGDGPGVIFKGRLDTFPGTWGTGIVDPKPASPATWTTDEAHVYRFTLQVDPDGSGQGQTGGGATFTWDAQNL